MHQSLTMIQDRGLFHDGLFPFLLLPPFGRFRLLVMPAAAAALHNNILLWLLLPLLLFLVIIIIIAAVVTSFNMIVSSSLPPPKPPPSFTPSGSYFMVTDTGSSWSNPGLILSHDGNVNIGLNQKKFVPGTEKQVNVKFVPGPDGELYLNINGQWKKVLTT